MIPQPSVNYERFPSEYFSGSDIRIYFEDVLIDEVTDLTFTMQEKVLPIFGYNSYTYDAIARGSRIIQGSFAINFKDVDYLRGAVESILNEKDDISNWEDNYPRTETNINENFNENKDYANKLHQYAERGWTTQFDRLAQELENEIWNNAQEIRNQPANNEPYFKGPQVSDGGISFDISIAYGAYKRPTPNNIESNYYQQINPGTIKTIHNVQLTGVRQLIDGSGQPIKEQYTFLARDLDRK